MTGQINIPSNSTRIQLATSNVDHNPIHTTTPKAYCSAKEIPTSGMD